MRMWFEGCEPLPFPFSFFQTPKISDLRLEVGGRLEWCASYNPNGENINLKKNHQRTFGPLIVTKHIWSFDRHKKHLVL